MTSKMWFRSPKTLAVALWSVAGGVNQLVIPRGKGQHRELEARLGGGGVGNLTHPFAMGTYQSESTRNQVG